MRNWQFFIDVGGTFTDVVAFRPDGRLLTHKLLSSGAVRGQCDVGSTPARIIDSQRIGDPDGFWIGYSIVLYGNEAVSFATSKVTDSCCATGSLTLDPPLPQA